jgi:hypothetical protein
MPSYIYKISSIDDKLNYYGLTTTTIENRFKYHIQNYNSYKQDIDKQKYCSSFQIFNTYPLDKIKIQLIEKYDKIPLCQLRDREIYYITNFDCVNILGKKKHSSGNLDDYFTLTDKWIHPSIITKNNIPITNINQNIQYIIQIIGYSIDNNYISQIKQQTFDTIKTQLHTFIKHNYTDFIIKKNNLLLITNFILQEHSLQIIRKKISYLINGKLVFKYFILLHPYTIQHFFNDFSYNNNNNTKTKTNHT